MLIKCPECEKEISDKAIHCIHCGFPLSKIQNDSTKAKSGFYRITIHPSEPNNVTELIRFLSDATMLPMSEANRAFQKCSPELFRGLSEKKANQIKSKLDSFNVNCEINSDDEFDPLESTRIYRIILYKSEPNNSIQMLKYLTEVTGKTITVVNKAFQNCSTDLLRGLNKSDAHKIKSRLESFNVRCDIQEDDPSYFSIPKCPKCGSTSISTGSRGVTLTTGFFGASQTMNRCGNCGYKWKP